MELHNQKKWLKELELQKNIALAQNERYFPAMFYNFTAMIIETPLIGEKLRAKMMSEFQTDKDLSDRTSYDAISSSYLLRRMPPARLWKALMRMFNFYMIYNPVVAQFIQQHNKEQALNAEQCLAQVPEFGKCCKDMHCVRSRFSFYVHLKSRCELLQNCVDQESEQKSSYDKNFDMAADKIAIQIVYAYFEDDYLVNLGQSNVFLKIKFKEETKTHIKFFVGKREASVSLNSMRGQAIKFFLKNSKCDDLKLCFLMKKIKNIKDMSDYDRAKAVVDNVNKFFNDFDIVAALQIEKIDSYVDDKLEITRNPSHW